MNNQSKQKGSTLIILVLIVALLALATYLYMRKSDSEVSMTPDSSYMQTEETNKFEDLEEPEGTPNELNNNSLEEMDTLMLEIEASTTGEDLSDL